VAGVPSQPNVYYFGATGGGVWKTTDGGANWEPISDNFSKPARSAQSPLPNPTRT
jgi:photosystem II stability/assembly factor-like uncharacterized protein